MPRLRIRRLLLTVFVVVCVTFLALNLSSHSSPHLVPLAPPGHAASGADGNGNFGLWRKPKFEDPALTPFNPPKSPFRHPEPPSSNHHQMERRHNSPVAPQSPKQGAEGDASVAKLWFMKGGGLRPQPAPADSKPVLWPEQSGGDRIVEQLMYVPPNYTSSWNFSAPASAQKKEKLKKILLYFGKGGWNDLPLGRSVFLRDKCPVNTCELTTVLKEAEEADAIFFKDRFLWPFYKRKPHQVWILFLLECPLHTQAFKNLKHVFNWTATYRHDSDLVAPYEKFVPYNASEKYLKAHAKTGSAQQPRVNFAANKTRKVAWFVSNCNAKNRRLEYARELGQHIEVDIYGSCGNKKCPRTLTHKCFKMLDRDYKFYLAFENSNCKDYITEKFFVNGLSRNIVPIVMGARPEDYLRSAPSRSYIHVDDFASPADLAHYLHLLDKNDTLYNEYFAWKGTGEFVNTYFWCRMCAMLHAPLQHKSYADMHKWWAGAGTCNASNWRQKEAPKVPEKIKDDKG